MALLKVPVSLWFMFVSIVSVSTFSRFFLLMSSSSQDDEDGSHDFTEIENSLLEPGVQKNQRERDQIDAILSKASSSSHNYKICTSPEDHVEWPLAGPVHSKTSDVTCGLESDSPFSLYLRHNLTLPLDSQQQCDRLVVYGVAFGEDYVNSLSSIHARRLDSRSLLATHDKCFFMFVLEGDMPLPNNQKRGGGTTSRSKREAVMVGHTWLIPIPRDILPYENLRRNVKLLKYNGHFLFPHAKAVIWQDAKFFQPVNIRKQPNNYFSLIPPDACVQVMGLPVHPNVFGLQHLQKAITSKVPYEPKYIHHCETIIESLVKRPDVTDSASNLMQQCYAYLQHVSSNEQDTSIMNHGLLDSAFVVWNQSTDQCRDFNAALQCTLSDQLQCHSDRDQVSIPFAFYKMGLGVHGATPDKPVDGRRKDLNFVLVNDDQATRNKQQVMVRMTRSSCHWYFSRLGACTPKEQPSIAVMVAGGAARFLFNSTVEHLMKPLVQKQGYKVDYYVTLTMEQAQAYRQDASYMNHITYDPIFSKSLKRRSKDTTEIMKSIRETMRDAIEDSGAYLAAVQLRGKSMVVDSPALRRRHMRARRKRRKEDVDLRFPTLDLRPKAQQRTAVGNRNMLRLFYAIEYLWDNKLVLLENVVGRKYDYVMILRDDTLWLDDFDMDALLATNPNADAYILSCDARDPPMMKYEVNDHGIILKRDKAALFAKYFTTLLSTDMYECHRRAKQVLGPDRGCNSEMILSWIMQLHELVVQKVPQSLIPFERAVTVNHNGKIKQCFHKFCQSKDAPLRIDPELMKCKDLTF